MKNQRNCTAWNWTAVIRVFRIPLALASLCLVSLAVASHLHAQQQEIGKRKDLGEFNLTLVGDNNIVTLATARQNNPKFMAAVAELRKETPYSITLRPLSPSPMIIRAVRREVRISSQTLRF